MIAKFAPLFEAFENKEKKLYHVGGSVRDMILGKQPKDFDFTTDALPEKTKEIVESVGYKTFPLGEKFGTIAAHVNGVQVEITTHRKDMTSGRHPEVSFTKELYEDLERRDFTINSMAMDKNGKLIDPFDGRKHIEARVIKTTGNAMERFSEDHLRMLRAIRFVSQLGFNVDRCTRRAIYISAQAILSVSRERLAEELTKLLLGSYADKALELLYQTRMLGYILPEVFPISKDLWEHTKIVVGKAKPTPIVRWAALLQHEAIGAELADSLCRRLRMPNDMRLAICGLVFLHQRIGDIVSRTNNPSVGANALRRLVRQCDNNNCQIEDLIELAIASGNFNGAALVRQALDSIDDLRPKLPSGIGKAIMKAFQIKPGPKVGELLNKLDNMLLDGEIAPTLSVDEMVAKLKGK